MAHARPASISSFVTVLRETSATRVIDRRDEPSQSIERIWTRLASASLFMPRIIARHPYSFKHKVYFEPHSRGRGGGLSCHTLRTGIEGFRQRQGYGRGRLRS